MAYKKRLDELSGDLIQDDKRGDDFERFAPSGKYRECHQRGQRRGDQNAYIRNKSEQKRKAPPERGLGNPNCQTNYSNRNSISQIDQLNSNR